MIGIAFEGCACRAAFHAGVATALVEGGLPIGCTAGASSGSVIAAALAAGRGAELPGWWLGLAGRSVVSWRRLLHNRSPFDMSTIVRTTLREALGDGDLRSRPIEALATATRLRGLRPLVVSSREAADFVEVVLGSCFFPVLYGRPVRLDGALVVDGGFTDNLPLEHLAARGATELVAVVTRAGGRALKSPWNLRWVPRVNGRRVEVLHPRRPLEIGSWDFDRDRMRRAIDEGLAVGREFLGG